MKRTVFIGTSLDGFIARKDGGIDWLPAFGEEDYGYGAFFKTVDALVMGRKSFETALKFPQWPYEDKPVIVLSRRKRKAPAKLADRVSFMTGAPAQVVRALARRGLKRLYVDGGLTIQRFLRAGLIDELVVTRVPVLIGEGRPLFGPTGRDVKLKHLRTKAYPDGLVQSRYAVL